MKDKKEPKDLLSAILAYAQKNAPVEEVRKELNIGLDKLRSLVEKLEKKGYVIQIETSAGKEFISLKKEADSGQTIYMKTKPGQEEIKILLISSAHAGLKSQQLHLLSTAYAMAKKEKVHFAIFCGNLCAGKPTKKNSRDFFLKGTEVFHDEENKREKREDVSFEKQLEYLKKAYPKTSIKTYFLSGWREMTFKEQDGQDFLKMFCEGSKRFFYSGDYVANFIVNKAVIEVMQAKNSEPYTKSYEIQGLEDKNKQRVTFVFPEHTHALDPDIICLGGRHVPLQIPNHLPRTKDSRQAEMIEIPSLAAEGSSEKVKNIMASARTLGFGILTLKFFDDGSLKSTVDEWWSLSAYQKTNGYLSSCDIDELKGELFEAEEELKQLKLDKKDLQAAIVKIEKLKEEIAILSEFISRPRKLGHLARILGFSRGNLENEEEAKKKVWAVIGRLGEKGFTIAEEPNEGTFYWQREFQTEFHPLDLRIEEKRKILQTSDWHFGNKKTQKERVAQMYKIAEDEKCDMMTVAGDIHEGMDAHPGHGQELEPGAGGADAQRELALKYIPLSDIPTAFIQGSAGHEYKAYQLRVGHDIVKALVEDLKRRAEKAGKKGDDLYLYDEKEKIVADYLCGKFKIMLRHPSGGAPKAKSYRAQEIIRAIFNEIWNGLPDDVHAISIGHLHLAMFMMYKGIAVYLVPCIVDMNDYLTSKSLVPDLGCWISEFGLDGKGNVVYVKNQYIAFEPAKRESIAVKVKVKE